MAVKKVFKGPVKKGNFKQRQKEAVQWWRKKIGLLNGRANTITARQILRKARKKFKPRPGHFVIIEYKALHADTLPYWDRFPLAVILEIDGKGWLALNLHYLPIALRLKVFNYIRKRVKNTNNIEQAYADISYATFKSISKLRVAKPALKRHLFSQMKKRPVRVTWDEAAEYAVYLDIEQWMVGHSPSNVRLKVYSDSLKMARRGKRKK